MSQTAENREDKPEIPKIIHQFWKTTRLPKKWNKSIASVKKYHPGWKYTLWTDDSMDEHIKIHHPDFFPIFDSFNYNIMKADAFRYVIMYDIGGLYCDIDYEFIRPYDYSEKEVVLSYESERKYGEKQDVLANCFFASTPGHTFWKDCIQELMITSPVIASTEDVVCTTGPGFITRVYNKHMQTYEGVKIEDKLLFMPFRVHGSYEWKHYLNNGITYGFHHGYGSWKERLSLKYWLGKMGIT